SFTKDLTLGSKGADVTALQQLLINAGDLNISAPTGYFGSMTKTALAAYQSAKGITPAAGYFGPKSRAFVNSMAVSTGATGTTTTTTGTTGTTGTTTVTAPASGLAVSLASNNPVAGSLISSASAGAARVPVLRVSFTAGNAGGVTVTGVNFHKVGVLSDSSIAGAYLTQGGKVLYQYNSLNQGVLSFSGMSLNVPAGQTVELGLAIDIASALSAGNMTSFSLNGASDISATSGTTAVTATGSFPLNGNTFTVTSVSNPALATLTITSSSIGTTVTAGTQGNLVGAWNFTGGNSKLWLKGLNFRVIGSANKGDIRNVKLMVNGAQVGATLATVGQDGNAYFDTSATPGVLNTGSNNVQLFADVMGSPSFNFQFEILNSYDVLAV
ncbi:MAG: peptidoglycan-binding protein, partial [Patescibacteria group bacterium]|nr:peptidoglycan-binding protein [Patescibacteria group bacterium]